MATAHSSGAHRLLEVGKGRVLPAVSSLRWALLLHSMALRCEHVVLLVWCVAISHAHMQDHTCTRHIHTCGPAQNPACQGCWKGTGSGWRQVPWVRLPLVDF